MTHQILFNVEEKRKVCTDEFLICAPELFINFIYINEKYKQFNMALADVNNGITLQMSEGVFILLNQF